MADRSVRIKLLADTSSYRSEMEKASRVGNNYYKTSQNSSQRLTGYLNQNTAAFTGLSRNIQTATNSIKSFAGAFVGAFAVSGVINVADNYGQMAQRIKNSLQSVDGDFSNYEVVQKRLLDTSIRNAKELADSQELYIRSAESMKDLGYTTNQTLDFVESLSSAFTANATSSDKVKSSIDALNKAFVSGKVSGDQWRTITAAMPNLAGELAKSLGKSREEVVKLGNSGKISITQLANGTIKAKDSFNALADSMDNTLKDGFVQLSNAFQSWIGEANQAHGVTSTLVQGMTYLAKNFDIVVIAGTGLVSVGLARYFGGLTTAMYTNVTAAIANTQATKANLAAELELAQVKRVSAVIALREAETKMAAAAGTNQYRAASIALEKAKKQEILTLNQVTAAQQRLNAVSSTAGSTLKKLATGAFGLIGGPAGAAMLAGGSLLYFMNRAEEAKKRALELGGGIEALKNKLEGLSKAGARIELKSLKGELEDQNKQISKQIGVIESLQSKLAASNNYSLYQVDTDKVKENISNLKDELAVMNEKKELKLKEIELAQKAINEPEKELKNKPNEVGENGDIDKKLENYLNNLENNSNLAKLELQGLNDEVSKFKALQAAGLKDDGSEEAQRVIALAAEYEKLNLAKQGKSVADQEIKEAQSPLERINADEQAKLDLLNQWKATGLVSEQTYQDALTATQANAAKKRKKIDDDERAAKLASVSMILSSSSDLFGGLADIIKTYEGKSSSAYKAMFAASKGFAIGNATLNLSMAIMQAMAAPSSLEPAKKLANYATIASAGGALVSQIASTSLTGMAHDGIDYIPKEGTWLLQKGERVLNADQNKDFSSLIAGKSSTPNIVINNNSSSEVTAEYDDREQIIKIAVNKAKAEVASSVRNKQGDVWNAFKTTTNVKSRL